MLAREGDSCREDGEDTKSNAANGKHKYVLDVRENEKRTLAFLGSFNPHTQ